MYADRIDGGAINAKSVAHVLINQIRLRLDGTPFCIESRFTRNGGYRLAFAETGVRSHGR